VVLAAVDLDLALQVRAVFDEDPAAGDVADHRAVILHFDAIRRVQIAADLAVDHDFLRLDVGHDFAGLADGEALALQNDRAFDLALDMKIFFARNLALNSGALERTGAEAGTGFELKFG